MNNLYQRDTFYIDGEWAEPATGDRIVVTSPTTELPAGYAPHGSPADMDRAIQAARRAFDDGPWPRMSADERAAVLDKMAEHLAGRADEIATLISEEMGSPISFLRMARDGEVRLFRYYADLVRKLPLSEIRQGAFAPARIAHEPLGVVAAITPWNGPLYILALKVAPALAAGCTVVAKPSAEAPLDAYFLAEAAVAAGLPPGVLNIVPGGRETGEYLVSHPGVDKVSFTGSTAAGRRIGSICGQQLKRASLELGGKSAAVVLDDAPLDMVVANAIPFGLAFNNGQACAALTRIVVPRHRQAELVEALTTAIRQLVVGDPRESATQVGPLVAQRQRERVEGYIRAGREAGAKLAIGGGRPESLATGWFVEPTLFYDVDNRMSIAREEIFGPVGVVIPYDGDDDAAIAIANDSPYGLAGAVFCADSARARRAASRVRAGTMGINAFFIDHGCPFGGFKASGIGREMGVEGLMAYTETKSMLGAVG